MSKLRPRHEFDPAHAAEFRSKSAFVKTAVLLELAEADVEVRIAASFGGQRMRGDFYVVANGDGSYGASRAEFEQTHEQVGPNQWVKLGGVQAYRVAEPCDVETRLADGTPETIVSAEPGDWIVRQASGEVMVLEPSAFAERYAPAE